MALGPDLARLQAFQAELRAAPLVPAWSYLSLTELSEYMSPRTTSGPAWRPTRRASPRPPIEERIAGLAGPDGQYREDKLHPALPLKKLICFYPMAKRRIEGANWYALPFEDRKRLMGGHARVGMTYAGRVLQLVTGSFAFDDWEWGVTLLADDPVALKEILYEMRFDEVSARYAEFGPFVSACLDAGRGAAPRRSDLTVGGVSAQESAGPASGRAAGP